MSLYFIDLRWVGLTPTNEVRFSNYEVNLIKNEMKNPENRFIFFALQENWPHTNINYALEIFGLPFFQENCIVLVDRIVENFDKINFYNVVRYDSQLMKVAIDEETSNYNKDINLDTGRFLFLMGKPYKKNRIKVLYELEKNNLLDKCDYSFVFHENYYQKTRKILEELTDDEFNQFVNRTQKTLDNIEVDLIAENYNYLGVPVDPNLYKNTSFSLISESLLVTVPHWFLSEKFWRTVASHHMFIIMTDRLSIDYLHSLGFSTFQQFLNTDKNGLDRCEVKLIENSIIEHSINNVEHLLKTLPQNKDSIEFHIKKNYEVYKQLVTRSREVVDKQLEKYLYVAAKYETKTPYYHINRIPLNDSVRTAIKKLWNT